MPGGEPFGALIGDYAFTNHPEDIELLAKVSNVAAETFCPFLSAASPQLFGVNDFTKLAEPVDLKSIFSAGEFAKWNNFRDSDESRFVVLAMPRVLSRLPYELDDKSIEEFAFEEFEADAQGNSLSAPHEHFAWMSPAWVVAGRLTDAFAKYGWSTSICGLETGGKVDNLPERVFGPDDGSPCIRRSTEIALSDRLYSELSMVGFLPLCHVANADYSVFSYGQTVQRFKRYEQLEQCERLSAIANWPAISARLPYIMATSRFAHYIMCIAREKIFSMGRESLEAFLQTWIETYVWAEFYQQPSAELKLRYPLATALLNVRDDPFRPGAYEVVALLRLLLPLTSTDLALRMVVRLPDIGR